MYTTTEFVDPTIDWDITTICQYKCSYCYARKEKDKWGKIVSKNQIDTIINEIDAWPYIPRVNLLGGEPTLHPLLNYITDKLLKSNILDIQISTNGSNIKRLPSHERIYVMFTYHPEHEPCKFINNYKAYKGNKGVTIMYDSAYIQNMQAVQDSCYPNDISYIEDDITAVSSYIGQKCLQSYFRIRIDGSCTQGCSKTYSNFNKNIKLFSKICDHICTNDCLKAQKKLQ